MAATAGHSSGLCPQGDKAGQTPFPAPPPQIWVYCIAVTAPEEREQGIIDHTDNNTEIILIAMQMVKWQHIFWLQTPIHALSEKLGKYKAE